MARVQWIVYYEEGLSGGIAMLKSWEGQGYMVEWPGCYMTCPGFNMNMVRVQHGVAMVKKNALLKSIKYTFHKQ